MTCLWWGEKSAQQSRAQTGGADLLLLCLTVVRIFKQLDLVKHKCRKALAQTSTERKHIEMIQYLTDML